MVRFLAWHGLSKMPPAQWLSRFHDTAFSDASVARDWVPILQKLTGADHLNEGILNSWGSLLGKNRGSGRWTTRWCACCLEDSHNNGQPYLPLAWSIGLIEACPIHRTQLESVCHHCGAGRTTTGRQTRRFAMNDPGVCGTCSQWLGTIDPRDPDAPAREIPAASDHAVCIARQIGTLLAEPMREDEQLGVHKVLNAAVQRFFGGSQERLSAWVGLNKSTIHGWLKGTVMPEMGRLAELAIKLRINLRDLVTGRIDDLPQTLEAGPLGLESRLRAAPRADEKREALRSMMEADPDIPIREMARRLDMNHRDVYCHAEIMARLHSQDRGERHQRSRMAALQTAEVAVLDKLRSVEDVGLDVTVRQLREIAAEQLPRQAYSVHQQVVHRALTSMAA